jgi:hypothetical protein
MSTILLQNSGDAPITVHFEPWGMNVALLPKRKVLVRMLSAQSAWHQEIAGAELTLWFEGTPEVEALDLDGTVLWDSFR